MKSNEDIYIYMCVLIVVWPPLALSNILLVIYSRSNNRMCVRSAALAQCKRTHRLQYILVVAPVIYTLPWLSDIRAFSQIADLN